MEEHLRVQVWKEAQGSGGLAIIPRGGKIIKGLHRVPVPGRHSGLKEEPTFLIESKQKVLYSFLQGLSLKMEHNGGEISFPLPTPGESGQGGDPSAAPGQQRPPQQCQEILSQV